MARLRYRYAKKASNNSLFSYYGDTIAIGSLCLTLGKARLNFYYTDNRVCGQNANTKIHLKIPLVLG